MLFDKDLNVYWSFINIISNIKLIIIFNCDNQIINLISLISNSPFGFETKSENCRDFEIRKKTDRHVSQNCKRTKTF